MGPDNRGVKSRRAATLAAIIGLAIAAVVTKDAADVHLKNCRRTAFVRADDPRLPAPRPGDDLSDPFLERGSELYTGCSRTPW